MTSFYDALNWMQNGKLQLLILSIGDEDISSELLSKILGENDKFFFFDYRQNSHTPMCLYEFWISNKNKNIEDLISKTIKEVPKNIDICFVFEGFVVNSDDLFEDVAYKYIYAIKYRNTSSLALSVSSRNTDEWSKKVASFQKAVSRT